MAKSLFTLRPDGRVLEFDGAWHERGSVSGLLVPSTDPLTAVWFKFVGKLFCAYVSHVGAAVCQYVQGDLVPVCSLSTDSAERSLAWGKPLAIGGAICWFERRDDGATHLYRFAGSSLTREPVLGFPGAAATSTFSPVLGNVTAVPYGQQLAIVPKAVLLDSDGSCQVRARRQAVILAIGPSSIALAGDTLPSLNIQAPAGKPGLHTMIGAGVFKDELFAVSVDGWLSAVEPDGTRKRRLADLRVRSSGKISTPRAGSAGAQIVCNKAAAHLMPFLMGAKVTVTSGDYAGRSGTVVGVFPTEEPQLAIATESDDFPALPAYTDVAINLGFGGGIVTNPYWQAEDGPISHTFFHDSGNALVGFVLGRAPLPGTAPDASAIPSVMFRYDGTRTSVTSLPSVSAFSASAAFDPSTNVGHVLYADGATGSVQHASINLTTGQVEMHGAVYAWSDTPPQFDVIAYGADELDITILNTLYDSEAGTVDVVHVVTAGAGVSMEYHNGTEWKPATAAASSTDGHFVHALQVDEPGFTGTLQYRASVRRG